MRDMVKGCCLLSELDIIHRDIRASNIYFSPSQKRYLLGNFSCARSLAASKQDE